MRKAPESVVHFAIKKEVKLARAQTILAMRRLGRGLGPIARDTVVSLTTTPSRIRLVPLVIDCLHRQTVRPESIVLYLSREEFGADLPRRLLAWTGDIVSIRYVDGNLRSYKKLVYALRDFPGKSIVTVDDDVLYAPDLIERLVAAASVYPDCVIFGRGRRMTHDGSWFDRYASWPYIVGATRPSLFNFPIGLGGILYPPSALSPSVFNQSLFQRLSPLADDVWFKAMSLLMRKACVGIDTGRTKDHNLPVRIEQTLSHMNVSMNLNDKQIEGVFGHFGLTPEWLAAVEAGGVPVGLPAAADCDA